MLSSYKIVVYTSDVKGAGTDANVSITLIGEEGTVGPRKLENQSKNLFERGQQDTFLVEAVEFLEFVGGAHADRRWGIVWKNAQRAMAISPSLLRTFPTIRF